MMVAKRGQRHRQYGHGEWCVAAAVAGKERDHIDIAGQSGNTKDKRHDHQGNQQHRDTIYRPGRVPDHGGKSQHKEY